MTGSLTPNKTSVLATEKSPVDPNSSEHIIAINRLQEQLDNLKKQLSQKDQLLLEKEKKVRVDRFMLNLCLQYVLNYHINLDN